VCYIALIIVFVTTNRLILRIKSNRMHRVDLAQIIKERRKVLGINQEELSELSEIGLRTIKGLESQNTNPTLNTVVTILDVLGLDLVIKTKK